MAMFGSKIFQLSRIFCVVVPAVNINTSSCLLMSSRRTGRGVASAFTWKDVVRLKEAKQRIFSREWGKRFGYETGIEDVVSFPLLPPRFLAIEHFIDC